MLFSDASGEISKSPPSISFLDHGFLFGDSLYEVVRTYNKKIWAWPQHLERLRRGGEQVGIDIESLVKDLWSRGLSLLKALDVPDAALRMVITRGIGKIHIDPRSCDHPLVYMVAWPLDLEILRRPVRLYVPKTRRNALTALDPAIKSGNYLNNILALREAVHAGYDDALLLNPAGEVAELTTSNIGWIKGDEIVTPHRDCGILHGITRRSLMERMPVMEGRFTLDNLMEADEIFALSTFKEILPVEEVKSFDGRVWKTGSMSKSQKLFEQFRQLVEETLAKEPQLY